MGLREAEEEAEGVVLALAAGDAVLVTLGGRVLDLHGQGEVLVLVEADSNALAVGTGAKHTPVRAANPGEHTARV